MLEEKGKVNSIGKIGTDMMENGRMSRKKEWELLLEEWRQICRIMEKMVEEWMREIAV
jgi:hypothetical protein